MNSHSSMESEQKTIKRLSAAHGFGISETLWREALLGAQADKIACIRHAELGGDSSSRLHVAEIADKVACHVHIDGHEVYEIVSGKGILYSGPVEKSENGWNVACCDALPVSAGDVFNVPESFAHQLVRTGADPLVIIFACSDNHLGADRLVLSDMKV